MKKHKKQPLVSIIMPAYNNELFIDFSIESVLNQTYKNWELIIVNDNSKDNTLMKIKKYARKDERIKYKSLQQNSGPAVARNTAINIAQGEYIAFLDSDDVWFRNKLEKQLNFMKMNNYNFTCTSYTKIDENGHDKNRIIKPLEKSDYWDLLKNGTGNSTVIYNAKKIGKFEIPNIRKRNDYVLWLQIIKKEKLLYGLLDPLSSHREHKEGISSNKFDLVKYHWIIYRDIENISVNNSICLILYWIFKSIIKK